MGSYNGGRYIAEQLDTIANQTHRDWRVIASDDGSSDDTLQILEAYSLRWGDDRLKIRSGPGQGFCRNFLSMAAAQDLQADYYAFSDQDDLWDSGKLERAIEWLKTIHSQVPALYCGRTRLADYAGNHFGLSSLFIQPPGLGNALVQNIAGGNTMVFNEAARKLLVAAGDNVIVPSHDWWLYILVSACGGVVKYDQEPMVTYRQHDKNIIGSNTGLKARISRIKRLISGQFRHWNELHLESLSNVRHLIAPENLVVLQQFSELRRMSKSSRLRTLPELKLYRQSAIGQAALIMAIIFGKI